jgi:uncharacterized membrane protein (UPF0127 family)
VAERCRRIGRWSWSGRTASALLAALVATACSGPFDLGGNGLPRATLEIRRDGESLAAFEVELALTPEDQAIGLMNRKSLPEKHGMAFLFSSPVRLPFHMQNTLIPLDIAFWDEGNEIVDILTMTPCDQEPCEAYSPSSEYVGAVEVNAGVLEAEGARPGDTVALNER